MEHDKKGESARVVGYFCQGFALLLLVGAIIFVASDRVEVGLSLLVIGIALLAVGIVTSAQGKRKTNAIR